MEGKIHFKITHGGVTRRFAIDHCEEDILFVLKNRVSKMTGTKDLPLYWKDEDSLVVLDCEEDMNAAIDYAETKNKLACVSLETGDDKEETKEEAAKVEIKIVTELESASAFNGLPFICNQCDAFLAPSNGGRFKCTICYDYDLCAACVMKGEHDNHAFVLLRDAETEVPMKNEAGGVLSMKVKDSNRCNPMFVVRNSADLLKSHDKIVVDIKSEKTMETILASLVQWPMREEEVKKEADKISKKDEAEKAESAARSLFASHEKDRQLKEARIAADKLEEQLAEKVLKLARESLEEEDKCKERQYSRNDMFNIKNLLNVNQITQNKELREMLKNMRREEIDSLAYSRNEMLKIKNSAENAEAVSNAKDFVNDLLATLDDERIQKKSDDAQRVAAAPSTLLPSIPFPPHFIHPLRGAIVPPGLGHHIPCSRPPGLDHTMPDGPPYDLLPLHRYPFVPAHAPLQNLLGLPVFPTVAPLSSELRAPIDGNRTVAPVGLNDQQIAACEELAASIEWRKREEKKKKENEEKEKKEEEKEKEKMEMGEKKEVKKEEQEEKKKEEKKEEEKNEKEKKEDKKDKNANEEEEKAKEAAELAARTARDREFDRERDRERVYEARRRADERERSGRGFGYGGHREDAQRRGFVDQEGDRCYGRFMSRQTDRQERREFGGPRREEDFGRYGREQRGFGDAGFDRFAGGPFGQDANRDAGHCRGRGRDCGGFGCPHDSSAQLERQKREENETHQRKHQEAMKEREAKRRDQSVQRKEQEDRQRKLQEERAERRREERRGNRYLEAAAQRSDLRENREPAYGRDASLSACRQTDRGEYGRRRAEQEERGFDREADGRDAVRRERRGRGYGVDMDRFASGPFAADPDFQEFVASRYGNGRGQTERTGDREQSGRGAAPLSAFRRPDRDEGREADQELRRSGGLGGGPSVRVGGSLADDPNFQEFFASRYGDREQRGRGAAPLSAFRRVPERDEGRAFGREERVCVGSGRREGADSRDAIRAEDIRKQKEMDEKVYAKASQVPAHMVIGILDEMKSLQIDDMEERLTECMHLLTNNTFSLKPHPRVFLSVNVHYEDELLGNIAVDVKKHLISLRKIPRKYKNRRTCLEQFEHRRSELMKALEHRTDGYPYKSIVCRVRAILLTSDYTGGESSGNWDEIATGFMETDVRRDSNAIYPRVASTNPDKEGLFAPLPVKTDRPQSDDRDPLTMEQREMLYQLRQSNMFDYHEYDRMHDVCRIATTLEEAMDMMNE